jgi:hypothetical protein
MEEDTMRRFLGLERASRGQIYDGMGLELWACGDAGETLLPCLEEDPPTIRPRLSFDTAFTASTGGTSMGEGLNYRIPFLHHRSTLSYNHPNPFTSTTTIGFSLPRASSAGTVVYEETSLLANMLIAKRSGD